jgi:hypothetical protein
VEAIWRFAIAIFRARAIEFIRVSKKRRLPREMTLLASKARELKESIYSTARQRRSGLSSRIKFRYFEEVAGIGWVRVKKPKD